MSQDSEMPADVLAVDTGTRSVSLRIDAQAYPLDAIYGASYLFLDRAWVVLDRPDAGHVRVTVAWRNAPAEGALGAAVEEFAEELVSCAWRAKVAQEGRSLIEAATSKAHSGVDAGPAGPSLEDLTSYEFSGDASKTAENAPKVDAEKETGPGPSNEGTEQSQSQKEGS